LVYDSIIEYFVFQYWDSKKEFDPVTKRAKFITITSRKEGVKKTAITPLLVMTEEKNQPWLLALGQILCDLGDTDNALAASLAYGLSCNHPIARGLGELIHGDQIIKEELGKDGLTIIQALAVNNAIKSISTNLDQFSNSSFWRAQKKLLQKLWEDQCIGEVKINAKRKPCLAKQIITKLRVA
jgi:hypothetical protein